MIRVASFLDDLRALREAVRAKFAEAPNAITTVASEELIASPMIIRARARMARCGRGASPVVKVHFEVRMTQEEKFRAIGFNGLRYKARKMGMQL